MADIKFNCPHCGKHLAGDAALSGRTIACPDCKQPIKVAAPTPVQVEVLPPAPQAKACPFCGESILASALKCRHCGEFLDGRKAGAAATEKKKVTVAVPGTKGHGIGCFRVFLCLLFPPLAVYDKGCGSFILTTLLTICGWIPGTIAALIICTRQEKSHVIVINTEQ